MRLTCSLNMGMVTRQGSFLEYTVLMTTWIWMLWWIGCRHQVQIESTPHGATVSWNDEQLGNTPLTQTFWWYPGRQIHLDVSKYGYRPMYVDVDTSISIRYVIGDLFHFRIPMLFGYSVRSTHTAIMVPEHGPAGTWTPEDAQSFQ